MIHLKDIPFLIPFVYTQKIQKHILLYNPRAQKGMILIHGKFADILASINGKNTLETILNSSGIKKPEIFLFFHNLLSAEIIRLNNVEIISNSPVKKAMEELYIWVYLTEQCNFRCTYCFIDKNPKIMSFETAERMIQQLYEMKKKYKLTRIKIRLAGGEPLLELRLIKHIMDCISRTVEKGDTFFQIGLITNGSLLTRETSKYFKENNIGLTISLDGVGKRNDITRKFSNGLGTFLYIEKGLLLAREFKILKNINITITPENIKGVSSVVEYCLKNKITMRFGFFKQTNGTCGGVAVEDSSVIIPYFRKLLKKIYLYYKKNKRIHSPLLDHSLLDDLNYMGGISENHCNAGESYFSISTEGRIMLCPASNMKLASIHDTNFIKQARIISNPFIKKMSVEHIPQCQECYWKYICGGGCMLERFNRHKDKPVPTYKCDIYKSMMPIILKLEAERILSNII